VEFEEFRAALQSCDPTQREALLLIGAPGAPAATAIGSPIIKPETMRA
jgi:hypothetical protein